jgi:putative transposase
VPTAEGDLHLAGVLDLGGRELVGWATAATQTSDLVIAAFHAALQRRGTGPRAGHHTDRGVQYTSHAYQTLLAQAGVTASMSRPGCCHDNAPMESFWATLKSELTHYQRSATREEARLDLFWYIEVFYNRHRLHSSLGYQSPAAYLARWGHDKPPVHETQT